MYDPTSSTLYMVRTIYEKIHSYMNIDAIIPYMNYMRYITRYAHISLPHD